MAKKGIGLLFICLLIGLSFWTYTKYKRGRAKDKSVHGPSEAGSSANKQSEFGLKMDDLKIGDGLEAAFGDTVEIHYVGMLQDGKKFDSTRDRQQPMKFMLGAGQILQGIDMGTPGMKVHGLRRLTVPPQFGYGDKGAGGGLVPPKATLVYEIELLKVEKRKAK